MNTAHIIDLFGAEENHPLPDPIESKQIHDVFLDIGIPPHLRGYQYLVYAMELILHDPGYMRQITSRLYVDIANHFQTSPSSVGRAMNRAVCSAWENGNHSFINYIFKSCVNPSRRVPTNSLFLSRIYYYLLSIKPK